MPVAEEKAASWAVLSVAAIPPTTMRFSTWVKVTPGSNTVAPVTRTVSAPAPPSTASPAAASPVAV